MQTMVKLKPHIGPLRCFSIQTSVCHPFDPNTAVHVLLTLMHCRCSAPGAQEAFVKECNDVSAPTLYAANPCCTRHALQISALILN